MIAFLNWLDGVLWGVPLIALMILTGLYFTVRSGFFQFPFWIFPVPSLWLDYEENRRKTVPERKRSKRRKWYAFLI